MQRPSKKLTKTVDHKLMMTQDLNYVQLKLNVEQKVLCTNLFNKINSICGMARVHNIDKYIRYTV